MAKKSKKKKQKNNLMDTVPATMILVLVALLLVFAGYMYLALKNGYKFDELIDNIVGNLIGVLAAFLLFDILYNKLTQDAYARETSQQISKTLMGDPDTLDAFSEEDKKAFLVSTIRSMVKDEDEVEMITGNLTKYIQKTKVSRIRKSFNYTINLTTEFPNAYQDFPGVKENEYFYVQENLNYEVKYLTGRDSNLNPEAVRIGFHFDKRNLDAGLMESSKDPEFSKCIFSENLEINKAAVDFLRSCSAEQLQQTYEKLFTVVLKVDGKMGTLLKVQVRDGGIVATYKLENVDMHKDEHSIRVIFHMPKMWNSIFEVTLVDPTKDPKITFDYMPGKMDVTMFSYLNKENEANDGAYEQQNGLYDIAIKEEWIYPKSGIVFHVKRKADTEQKEEI